METVALILIKHPVEYTEVRSYALFQTLVSETIGEFFEKYVLLCMFNFTGFAIFSSIW